MLDVGIKIRMSKDAFLLPTRYGELGGIDVPASTIGEIIDRQEVWICNGKFKETRYQIDFKNLGKYWAVYSALEKLCVNWGHYNVCSSCSDRFKCYTE